MGLQGIGEFGFIEQIQKRFSHPNDLVLLGIGDDAAAFIPTPQTFSLLTTDTLVEETHFRRAYSSFEQIGYKAVAVNLSDIASMGGVPRFFLTSLGLTDDIEATDLNKLYRGIAKGSKEAKIELIGGNTVRSEGFFFITITLMGEVSREEMIRRSGAKPGDLLYVTGTLGDADAGLNLLKSGGEGKNYTKLINRHHLPKARFREGRTLGKEGIPSAMIDLSDGLVGDLKHLMTQSRVGAELMLKQIPISPSLRRYTTQKNTDPVKHALFGGEDYELLFSVPPERLEKLEALKERRLIQATRIGTILAKREGLVLREKNGSIRKLDHKGYQHFS